MMLSAGLQIPPSPPFCELGEKLPIPAKPDSKWGIIGLFINRDTTKPLPASPSQGRSVLVSPPVKGEPEGV